MLSFQGGMTMHVAQSGIFALGTSSHSYLEFDLHTQGDPLTLVQVIASLEEPRMTTGGVNLVVGFRPSLWARVAPEDAPVGVSDFERDVRGVDGYTIAFEERAISTLSEVFLQNHASPSRQLPTRKPKSAMNWLIPQAQSSEKLW